MVQGKPREPRQSKADWYVWADAKPDGTPPNNWLSIFGGVAWPWEPRGRQYYLHNFLFSQPDLNFHNPQVRQATLDNIRFWLERGVDGLRLDAINFCFHDPQLRDNPTKPLELRVGRGFSPDNPYAFQYHHHNNTQPENLGFLEDLRALLDRYPMRPRWARFLRRTRWRPWANTSMAPSRLSVALFARRVAQAVARWGKTQSFVGRMASTRSPVMLRTLPMHRLSSLRGRTLAKPPMARDPSRLRGFFQRQVIASFGGRARAAS